MLINIVLRSLTLVILIIWRIYWFLHAKEAAIKKPKIITKSRLFEKILLVLVGGYVIGNLIGFVIFPFNNLLFQMIGFILVIIGFTEAIIARKTLDDNWTECHEYQVKKNHELITNGIYRYVRHPIYSAALLMVSGALLVSGSFTFIFGLIIIFIACEVSAQREEKILTKNFDKKYIEYKKTTKKFIPFVY